MKRLLMLAQINVLLACVAGDQTKKEIGFAWQIAASLLLLFAPYDLYLLVKELKKDVKNDI